MEKIARDRYGEINYINDYCRNTGSVAQLTYGKDNLALDESLKKTRDFLDRMYEKYNIEERIASKKF